MSNKMHFEHYSDIYICLCNCILILFNCQKNIWTFSSLISKLKILLVFLQDANYQFLLYDFSHRNIICSLDVTAIFFFRHQKDADVFDLFLHATAEFSRSEINQYTLYECISIRLQLQCIKRYVVVVCLMHHMCPCSFRCRYVFMFRFESFYSSESGWKCRSESQRFIFRIFMYRMFAKQYI